MRDWGIRGFVDAYKASTGERLWRFWTIPLKGEPGSETWKGKEPVEGGGSTWLTGTYDPDTDTLFWPTGNPFPNSDDRDRPGDNLFTNCILALDPNTGKLKWHYQFTPHDIYDWDATGAAGAGRHAVSGRSPQTPAACRSQRILLCFRSDQWGKLLLAEKFISRLTWASGIGTDGRPQRLPEPDIRCPEDATNWNATAFSPVTRLYYVMAHEKCVVKLSAASRAKGLLQGEVGKKILKAIDIETGKIVWENPQTGVTEGEEKCRRASDGRWSCILRRCQRRPRCRRRTRREGLVAFCNQRGDQNIAHHLFD